MPKPESELPLPPGVIICGDRYQMGRMLGWHQIPLLPPGVNYDPESETDLVIVCNLAIRWGVTYDKIGKTWYSRMTLGWPNGGYDSAVYFVHKQA